MPAVERNIRRQPDFLYPASADTQPLALNDDTTFVAPPEFIDLDKVLPPAIRRLVGKFDPAERDARNRDLGKAGERFVVEFERIRLRQAGREDLADNVRWFPTWMETDTGTMSVPLNPMGKSGCWKSRRRAGTNARRFGSRNGRSTSLKREATDIESGASFTFGTMRRCSRSLHR